MCQICRLRQRHANAQRPTPLLDTSQFSALIVTDHRQTLAVASLQFPGPEESLPDHSNQNTTLGNTFLPD